MFIFFFSKVYTRIMGIMCVYHSGSRQENRNFDKSFKLIQGIGYTGNREARTPRRMVRELLHPQGLRGHKGGVVYGDQELRLSRGCLTRGGGVPRGTVATEGGAGVSLLLETPQEAESERDEIP